MPNLKFEDSRWHNNFWESENRARVTPGPAPSNPRFWNRVNKDGPIPEHQPELGRCWLWTGSKRKGYGSFRIDATHVVSAHRFSFELHHAGIDSRLMVLHKCDVPGCVRPDHLFQGTNRDNVADMRAKNRSGDYAIRGEGAPMAKLDAAAVLTIRAKANYLAQKTIASQHQITQMNVSYIVRGKSWGHISIFPDRTAGLVQP